MAGVVEKLQEDELFSEFMVPIDDKIEFRDATYYLREDGTFVFSQGYCHPPAPYGKDRLIVSHLIFVPQRGDIPDYAKKVLFGQAYENITKEIMENHPPELFDRYQMAEYLKIDPELAGPRPEWAAYKVFVPLSSMVGYFPTRHSMEAIFRIAEGGDEKAGRIKRAIESSAGRLGIAPEQYGMSGSVSLGNYFNPHDLDVVIHGTVPEIRRVVELLRALTAREEERQVHEFGKFWPIRYWEEVDGEKVMICPFFSLLDPDEFPLRDFTAEELGQVEIEGRVADHTFNAFNPTVLGLEDVKIDGEPRPSVARLVLYHGVERGDYWEGDRIEGEGTHTIIRTSQDGEFEAVVAPTMGGIKKVE